MSSQVEEQSRPQRVRIQVGLSQSTTEDRYAPARLPTPAATAAAAAAAAANALPYAQTTTLFDLCDSSYMTKKVKRPRKKKLDGVGALAAAAAAAIPADAGGSGSSGSRGGLLGAAAAAAAAAAAGGGQIRRKTGNEPRSTGPQVEFVDGNIVLKESSLVLPDATGDEEYEEMEEGVHATATYNSFLKRKSGLKWGFEETWLFYKALRQCGTEFSLMQSFFPGRTRKQLKLKFQKEEREHPELIRRTLDHSMPLELDPFRAQFGQILTTTGGAAKNRERAKEKAQEEEFVPVLQAGRTGVGVLAAAAAGRGSAAGVTTLGGSGGGGGGSSKGSKKRKAIFNPDQDNEDDLVDV